MDLRYFIRDIPDFPKPGILFKDITPLLLQPQAFLFALDQLHQNLAGKPVDKILGVESRGFIFGAALAARLGLPFVPVRKPGKLPYETVREEYALEYGTDALELHRDAIAPGEQIWLIDDLLATGGTALAAANLVKKLQGHVAQISFIIELEFLEGRKRLQSYSLDSLIRF